jgi:hypothetical protein
MKFRCFCGRSAPGTCFRCEWFHETRPSPEPPQDGAGQRGGGSYSPEVPPLTER